MATEVHSPNAIFISHRAKDLDSAHVLKDILRELLRCEVCVSTSPEPYRGRDWQACLRNALGNVAVFIFIMADQNENWDWCLYEVGFFEAITRSSNETKR